MPDFKEFYKSNLAGSREVKKMSDSEIADNPILALKHGTPEGTVRQILAANDYSEKDINYIIMMARNAK